MFEKEQVTVWGLNKFSEAGNDFLEFLLFITNKMLTRDPDTPWN